MKLYLTSLAITAGISLVMTVAGRVLVSLMGPRWGRGRTPEHFALAALLGTAAAIIGFGWLSQLGVSGRTAAIVLGAALALLVPGAWLRSRGRLFGPASPFVPWLGLAGVVLGGAALALLPLRYGGFCPFNDAFTYITIAEWLQEHGFGEPCSLDPEQPSLTVVHQYQSWNLRMGSTFLLALVRATLPHYPTHELFLPVTAWGVALNQLAIFLVCRWVFRLPRAFGLAAGVMAVVFVNPFFFAVHEGFQPQLFGTALLTLLIALLTRTLVRCRWRTRDAGVLALAGAGLLSVYSEMVPVAGLTAAAYTMVTGWRALRRGGMSRLAGFLCLAVLLAILLGNVEWLRFSKALPVQLKAVVPIKVEWPLEAFATFALGIGPIAIHGGDKLTWGQGLAAGLTALCCVLGLVRCITLRRAWVLTAAVAVFALMAVYFGCMARDPLTGRTGHGWSLLKLCQWATPLVMCVEAAGLRTLLRHVPAKGFVALAIPLAILPLTLPTHREVAKSRAAFLTQWTGQEQSFQALRCLRRQIDASGADSIYLLSRPDEGVFPRSFVAYLLYPRPFVNGWKGSWLEPSCPSDLADQIGPTTLVLSWKPPPFEAPAERLHAGCFRLSGDRPIVIDLLNPNCGVYRPDGAEPLTWLGSAPARLVVWSPQAGRADLEFTAHPGPSRPDDTRRRLVVREPTGAVKELNLPPGGGRVSIPVDLPAGTSALEVHCPDPPTVEMRSRDGQSYQLLVAVQAPRLILRQSPAGQSDIP